MIRAPLSISFLALLCLTACGSSEVIEDHYYSLVLAAGGSAMAADNEVASAQIIVGPIQLPTYLSGRGLPMQVAPNRIESASHHLWAEPLDGAIAKVLARDIAERTDGIDVERESGRWTADADCRIRIEFDAFHPTYESRVVTSGRYWIVSDDSTDRHDFTLTRALTIDGYAHAVDVLKGTLEALANQISEDLRSTPACRGSAGPDVAGAKWGANPLLESPPIH